MVSGHRGGWLRARARALLRRWRGDESGATAVEFGIIALPFLLLLFGTMSVCLFYFANFAIENAVWQAARAIRTGQLQQGKGAYTGTTTNADKKAAFKKALCAAAPTFLDCNSKAVVIVQSNANFGSISEPSCTNKRQCHQRQLGRLQHRLGQLGGAGNGLLPLGIRRQAAALQDGQPQ